MNIHIRCPVCGAEWDDIMLADKTRSREVDISDVHGAKVISKGEGNGASVKLVQVDDVFLLLISEGVRKPVCKVVPEESANTLYTQAVNDFLVRHTQ